MHDERTDLPVVSIRMTGEIAATEDERSGADVRPHARARDPAVPLAEGAARPAQRVHETSDAAGTARLSILDLHPRRGPALVPALDRDRHRDAGAGPTRTVAHHRAGGTKVDARGAGHLRAGAGAGLLHRAIVMSG